MTKQENTPTKVKIKLCLQATEILYFWLYTFHTSYLKCINRHVWIFVIQLLFNGPNGIFSSARTKKHRYRLMQNHWHKFNKQTLKYVYFKNIEDNSRSCIKSSAAGGCDCRGEEDRITHCVSPCRMRSQICRMDSQSVSRSSWLVALSAWVQKALTCMSVKWHLQQQLHKTAPAVTHEQTLLPHALIFIETSVLLLLT